MKGLIEKIQEEGVKAASDKARQIELEAKRKADEILKKAQQGARDIIAKAEEEVAKLEEGGKASLKQAGRDILLSLKKEISAVLDRLILLDVRKSLEPTQLVKIISALIKESAAKAAGDIIISFSKEGADDIKRGLLSELGSQIKKGVTLRASEDVTGGFTISYDAGKSHFDFTDIALAEYVGSYLKPKLGELLKESAKI